MWDFSLLISEVNQNIPKSGPNLGPRLLYSHVLEEGRNSERACLLALHVAYREHNAVTHASYYSLH